jgi:hypothetical protein
VAYPASGLILLSIDGPGIGSAPDLDTVLVHELSHIALFRAIDGHRVPRWFTEGLAIHQAKEQTLARMQSLYAAMSEGRLLPLSELDGAFGAHAFEVTVAYAQSADLVGFLKRDDRSPYKLRRLVTALRRGVPFDRALQTSFNFSGPNLEREWRADLRERFGSLPIVLGGSALWVFASVLLVIAFRKRRKQHALRIERMGHEEAVIERLERLVEAKLEEAAEDEGVSDEAEDDTSMAELSGALRDEGVPTIVHDGRSHTIH